MEYEIGAYRPNPWPMRRATKKSGGGETNLVLQREQIEGGKDNITSMSLHEY
jgi:hypothetical protein